MQVNSLLNINLKIKKKQSVSLLTKTKSRLTRSICCFINENICCSSTVCFDTKRKLSVKIEIKIFKRIKIVTKTNKVKQIGPRIESPRMNSVPFNFNKRISNNISLVFNKVEHEGIVETKIK